jgi:hypothetical protein
VVKLCGWSKIKVRLNPRFSVSIVNQILLCLTLGFIYELLLLVNGVLNGTLGTFRVAMVG